MNKTLYKLDSKDKLRSRNIYTEWDTIIQEAWLHDWKKVISKSKSKPKNVWRSNETTAEQQAILEAESKVNKKIDSWYFDSIDGAKKGKAEVILPMLAHSYDKHSKKIDWSWDVLVQPKLDWMRALLIVNEDWVRLISRKWKNIDTMDHIRSEAINLQYWIYDWELYAHWYSFQDNMRMIKKYRKWESEKVGFTVYDIIWGREWKRRTENMLHIMNWNYKHINIITTHMISEEKHLKYYHWEFLHEWYEWTMIRHWNAWYEVNKRSYSLLKYKDFLDETYEILDVIPMENRPEQWVVVCKSWDKTFKATPKMSHKEREELLANKKDYIGKTAEVRFFEYTDDWIPRFPVFIWVRLDK